MTDTQDSRVPIPVEPGRPNSELRRLILGPPLTAHGWLVRHRYVLRHNRSALGLTINYIVLMTVPVFPLLIYVHWVATRSFPEGDEIDFKGIVFLLVAVYFFGLATVHLLMPWGDFSSARELALWGVVVLAATTVYKILRTDPRCHGAERWRQTKGRSR